MIKYVLTEVFLDFMLDVICVIIGFTVLVSTSLCKCLKEYPNGFVQNVSDLRIQKFFIVYAKSLMMINSKSYIILF